MDAEPRKKSMRGFASMTAEKRRQIASLGGKAAHAKGRAHEWTREEAQVAGRKAWAKGAQGRDMSELGRRGGNARAQKHRAQREELAAGAPEDASTREGGVNDRPSRPAAG